jgi:hypothetical protein
MDAGGISRSHAIPAGIPPIYEAGVAGLEPATYGFGDGSRTAWLLGFPVPWNQGWLQRLIGSETSRRPGALRVDVKKLLPLRIIAIPIVAFIGFLWAAARACPLAQAHADARLPCHPGRTTR